MVSECPDSDNISVFPSENTDSFHLGRLGDAVSGYFGEPCALVKIGEGGYHKVYDIISRTSSRSLDAVVRVAAPAFPRDKMLSEIATIKYIATHTTIPVPQLYTWNVDASNPVGAEYMVMQKIPGIAPDGDKWKLLPMGVKLNLVRQVAEHWATLFSLRFKQAGSLYFSTGEDPSQFKVGPIVSLPFYRMVDGVVEHPDMPPNVRAALDALRGPFNSTSDYLASHLKATLLKTDPTTLENVHDMIQLAFELCYSYPGDQPVPREVSTPGQPFTVMLDDFRLANILIDESSGQVNGYIDLEGTSIAPLWQSATVPQWIPDPDGDMANWYGGTPEDQRALWLTFHATIDRHDCALTGGEWRKAYELGNPFRSFVDRLSLGLEFWDEEMETWIKERLERQSKKHMRVGMTAEDWQLRLKA